MEMSPNQETAIYVHGMGHFHPQNIIDNAFLESLGIETSDEWIMERVGIRTRRTVLSLEYIQQTYNQDVREAPQAVQYTNAETAKAAAQMALQKAGLEAGDIGMVIAGGCSPDIVTPAEAARIANELGIQGHCLDINAACSSFGAQVYWLSCMRPEAMPKYILLVSPENNTRTINYRDRNTAVLWGDGTSAAVVSLSVPSRIQISGVTFASDPSGWDKVFIPRTGHFQQQGSAVQAFAIKTMVQSYRTIASRYSKSSQRIFFIGHQANLRILESICERCQIKPENHHFNVDAFGNTGAAGAPITLSQNWEKYQPGDVVAMAVAGAGLSWAGLAFEFN